MGAKAPAIYVESAGEPFPPKRWKRYGGKPATAAGVLIHRFISLFYTAAAPSRFSESLQALA